jgi:hypothetical protein
MPLADPFRLVPEIFEPADLAFGATEVEATILPSSSATKTSLEARLSGEKSPCAAPLLDAVRLVTPVAR